MRSPAVDAIYSMYTPAQQSLIRCSRRVSGALPIVGPLARSAASPRSSTVMSSSCLEGVLAVEPCCPTGEDDQIREQQRDVAGMRRATGLDGMAEAGVGGG